MPDTLGFTVLIANLDNAGPLAKKEPARNRQYTITATPVGGGKVWRTDPLNEQQYREAIGTLISEKCFRLLPAIESCGNWSPAREGELVFSLDEIQGMGLTERRH